MAGGLSMFFYENATKPEPIFAAISERFCGEDGAPAKWKIHPITAAEDRALRARFIRTAPTPGKSGQYQPSFDTDGYLAAMLAKCTAYPDLNDKELQDSYGVMGAEDLLGAMLLSGEYSRYSALVQQVCRYETFEEMREQAKN